MGLHTRNEWATLRPAFSPAAKGVGHIVIHHTAGSSSIANKAQTLRGLEAMVTRNAPGNSSPLIALDYNLMIFADGDVWAGRGIENEDAATLRYNAQSVSICAVGNYDVDQPPPELLRGIAYAIQVCIAGGWFIDNPHIDTDVEGHRDVGTFATACPGRFLEAQLPQIRRLVAGATVEDDMYTDKDRARDNETHDMVGWLFAAVFGAQFGDRVKKSLTPAISILSKVRDGVAAVKKKLGA